MTDFIIGVNSAEEWHKENLASHPSHYSGLARLAGPAQVTRLQQEFGAKFYFNTLVPWRDKVGQSGSVFGSVRSSRNANVSSSILRYNS